MSLTARTLRLATVLAAILLPDLARADFTLSYSLVDTPVNVLQPVLPNSMAEYTSFEGKAKELGTLVPTDLSTASTETPTTATFSNGLSIALSGAKTSATVPEITSGIVSTNANPVDGFSVTPNSMFLRLTPDATNPNVTMTTASFTFAHPVLGFGVYITGLGTAPGALQALVYDGGPLGYQSTGPIVGNSAGGAQYLDILSPGAGFTRVDFQMRGFTTTSRDIISFDGISFINPVPEPATSVLLAIGGLALLGSRYLSWKIHDR